MAVAAFSILAEPGRGQTPARATIVESLLAYPTFHNAHTVRVRGVVAPSRVGVELVARGARILLLGAEATGAEMPVEVTGTFLDIGRLSVEDPRLQRFDIPSLARERLGREWPSPGDLLAIAVDAVDPVEPFPAASVRALALSPEAYVDTGVSVVGRFRGRNLYGDLPRAPGLSSWDFVLQSADAAVWVVGQRPRGTGFSLDPGARVDTGRWLQVEGRVEVGDGLVWIEATDIGLADPGDRPEPVAPQAPPPPRPEVTFSLPTDAEAGASRTGPIRIQFSRDMASRSFEGHVRVTYREGGSPEPHDADRAKVLLATLSYDEGRRVLEIHLAEPFPPFVHVRVSLGDGITSTTGEALEPWSFAFTTGQ